MCFSAAAAFSVLNPSLPLPGRRRQFTVIRPISHFLTTRRIQFSDAAVIARSGGGGGEVSWCLVSDSDDGDDDGFGGWGIVDRFDSQFPVKKKRGVPVFFVFGVGASVAVILAAAFHFMLAGRGFKLPLTHQLHVTWFPSSNESIRRKFDDSDSSSQDCATSEAIEVELPGTVTGSGTSEKYQPRIIPAPVDSTQLEAISSLKALKIIEDNVKAGELCKRREYARWLVRANSLLERNQKLKINPSLALSGSLNAAFQDANIEDPDFGFIQALAEAGVVFSKISTKEHGSCNFYTDRFISRQDLIEWKAQLEYDLNSTGNVGIPKSKLDLMDIKDTSMDMTRGLFMDLFAGDKSLLSRVFGQTRRLQPDKPATKAQAAVALASGRMAKAIHDELSRIEAEESSRQASKEEIKNELLAQGEIQRIWDEKMERERFNGLKVQESYIKALGELEMEINVREKALGEYWKEKSAIDCQKQLLDQLKMEIDEMSERLAAEGAEQIAEEETTRVIGNDLQAKWEGVLDAKSILEAEIEAVRILRSWIEDEVRKNQARSKVLKEVGRRWRWDGYTVPEFLSEEDKA
ncbi:hypothetical protein AKJ16_DCAP03508 [Drosera capensis]